MNVTGRERASGRKVESVMDRFAGRNPEHADEGPPQRLARAVAATPGDPVDGVVAFLQQAAGRLQPYAIDVAARGLADLSRERPGELPRGQARPPSELRDAEVGLRVVGDPPLHLAQAGTVGQLGRELGAELRLGAARGANGRAAGSRRRHLVRRAGEHFQRPRHVKTLHTGVQQNQNVTAAMPISLRPGRNGSNVVDPTFYATALRGDSAASVAALVLQAGEEAAQAALVLGLGQLAAALVDQPLTLRAA
jgi:hypothetical protein